MATKTNPGKAQDKRRLQLDAVLIQLTSQRPSDVWRGMEQVRQWLKKDSEDREVYGLLLDAVEKNRELREQVRNTLTEMMQNNSQVAAEALRSLPSGIPDLLADADDVYYAAEYDKAIQLYRQVLRLDPENTHSKDHLAKAILKRDTGESATDLPRSAQQYYRRARSFIGIRDVVTAMNLLNAAIEAAQAKGMKYPEAEEALNDMQNLVLADEQVGMASQALKKGQRKQAITYYQNALKLDPTNTDIRKKLRSQQFLLNAWWSFPSFLFIAGLAVYGISTLVPFNPLSLSTATLTETFVIASSATSTVKVQITNTPLAEIATETSTASVTDTSVPSSTFTETVTSTPTELIVGVGYINKSVASVWKEPNSGLESQLGLNQTLILLEERIVAGSKWYRCRWKTSDGQTHEGWILGTNITFGPPPSPHP